MDICGRLAKLTRAGREQLGQATVRNSQLKQLRLLLDQPVVSCDAKSLAPLSSDALAGIFRREDIASDWKAAEHRISAAGIPDMRGGVNPGDRRALFYLVRALRPTSILETGTHLGSSTLAIALAAKLLGNREEAGGAHLTTVDIKDVNSEMEQPWKDFGSSCSPRELLSRSECSGVVEFRVGDSLRFLGETSETYDFIFLDGSHDADFVYQEVPRALHRLSPGGYILLHDYFPDMEPIWQGDYYISGVMPAIKRLRNEGHPIGVLPLGELPWPTKLGSSTTSLALLVAGH